MSDGGDLFSREEILGGLPAKRARSLVFLIERATVRHMATREVGPMALAGEGAAHERSLAWFEAYSAAGEEDGRRPSIREIESAAPSWAPLVPETPAVRAAAARVLAERHELDRDRIPGTRSALGLDEPEVAAAFARQGDEGIDSIYTRSGPVERLRWIASSPGRWLETTTPFRAAAALTFMLSMGQTVVVVPIAVATVGLPVALASIAVIGLFALTTTAAIAEATTRNGEVRLRGGFFGRLVTSALGGPAGSVPAALGIASVVLPTLSVFIGLALLLELTIPVPAVAWVAILGVIGVVTPLRRPRATSFGFLMAIGIVSTALVAALSLLVLAEAAIGGDIHAPALDAPGSLSVELALGVIIGVLLATYADPVYTVQIGKLILPNDPDGSGYVRGSVAGMAAFVLVTAVFSVVLLLVLTPAELASQDGSALDPLADRYSAVVVALATVIGITLFGMRLYGNAVALFDFVDERLPGRRPPGVILRAGRGHVRLGRPEDHGAPALQIAYRGLRAGAPVVAVSGSGSGERRLAGQERLDAGGEPVTVEVVSADEDHLQLTVDTALEISYDADASALGPGVAESLLAEDEGAELVAWLLREGGARPVQAAERFGWPLEEARSRLEELVAGGRAERSGPGTYAARLGSRRVSALGDDLWGKLAGDDAAPSAGVRREGGSLRVLFASPVARAVVASVPVAGLAVLSAVLIAAGTASVSGPIRIVGVIAFATISGVLPPMLLLAARRRSDIAGVEPAGPLVSPAMLVATLVLAFATLVLHATVLWDDPVERACAAVATVFAVAAVLLAFRHGAFRPTVLVELRQTGAEGRTILRVEEAGEPLASAVEIAGGGRGGVELKLAEGSTLTIEGRPVEASSLVVSAQRFEGGAASALEYQAELVRGGTEAGSVSLAESGGVTEFETGGEWTLRVGRTPPGVNRS